MTDEEFADWICHQLWDDYGHDSMIDMFRFHTIETVRKMYEIGLNMPFVYNPVAWALHQAWKIADIKGKRKKEGADVSM